MLKSFFDKTKIEAGCDEAGRGCLAGPVFAAAVILPVDYKNDLLNDSKQCSLKNRDILRKQIENDALDYAVASVDNNEIDKINILNASFKAMHIAIDKLKLKSELLLIDGNRFIPYQGIKHICFIKGDAKYLAIAAASILAKTYRDDYMSKIDSLYPNYLWKKNKGYPTKEHRDAIYNHGLTEYHRRSYNIKGNQLKLF